jgi:hypothetical protein
MQVSVHIEDTIEDTIEATIAESVPTCNDAKGFKAARAVLRRAGGAPALLAELKELGLVENGQLTTGTNPFNVFARVASGAMTQPGMEAETANLGAEKWRFMIASNRPENDEHWASEEKEWVGKASMAKRHRFILVRDLSWSLFNVLTFGMASDDDLRAAELLAAISMLQEMQTAATEYVSNTDGWSNNVGMYFHVYGHASVNALHLHLVDKNATGPTFDALSYKNLPLQAVLDVLREELDQGLKDNDTSVKLVQYFDYVSLQDTSNALVEIMESHGCEKLIALDFGGDVRSPSSNANTFLAH